MIGRATEPIRAGFEWANEWARAGRWDPWHADAVHARLTALLLSGALIAAPAPAPARAAAAHAELVASSPAAGVSLAAPPGTVSLTFDEPVTLADNPVEVIGSGNVTWQLGTPTVAGDVVSAPVTASGPSGAYTLVYRVVSDDGDAVSGSVQFTLTAAAGARPATSTVAATSSTAAPTRPDPAVSDGGTLLWVWLLAGAVLLAALVFVTLRVRHPRR
jgi:methionine-rich copper-binding protein CopC